MFPVSCCQVICLFCSLLNSPHSLYAYLLEAFRMTSTKLPEELHLDVCSAFRLRFTNLPGEIHLKTSTERNLHGHFTRRCRPGEIDQESSTQRKRLGVGHPESFFWIDHPEWSTWCRPTHLEKSNFRNSPGKIDLVSSNWRSPLREFFQEESLGKLNLETSTSRNPPRDIHLDNSTSKNQPREVALEKSALRHVPRGIHLEASSPKNPPSCCEMAPRRSAEKKKTNDPIFTKLLCVHPSGSDHDARTSAHQSNKYFTLFAVFGVALLWGEEKK